MMRSGFTLDKSGLNHSFKFEVWKKSMMLRYFIEGAFTIALTFIFQDYLSKFNYYLHLAMEEALLIVHLIEIEAPREKIHHEKELLHHEL